jgi:hypothetical protein
MELQKVFRSGDEDKNIVKRRKHLHLMNFVQEKEAYAILRFLK